MGSNKFNKVSGETEMRIETDRLVIRDLEQKDKEQLFKIVWQKEVIRFMRDWSEHIPSAESLTGYVDWHQTQKESTDMYECKRYAVALKENDLLIGTVGMGFEDTLNEVEMAYFIDEEYQGKGYMKKILEHPFSEAAREGIPCVLDTDTALKVAKYTKCGMKNTAKKQLKSGQYLYTMEYRED